MNSFRLVTIAAGTFILSACGQSEAEKQNVPAAASANVDSSSSSSSNSNPSPSPSPSPSPISSPSSEEPAIVAAAGERPKEYAQCAICHSTEAGKNGIGPSLAGVYQAKAAHVGNFAYSTAMRESGIMWDDKSLDEFLEKPQATIRGTKMSFGGVRNAQQRAALIAYLKTL